MAIGEKMRSSSISRVLASKNPKFKEGDIVNASVGWTEVAIVDEKLIDKVELPQNSRVTDSLGVLGMTGLTAYVSAHIFRAVSGRIQELTYANLFSLVWIRLVT